MTWQEESITLGLRLVVGVTFLRAGLSKIAGRDVFALAVENYRLVGPRASRHIARWLPPVEVLLGGLVLVGVMRIQVALALTALLVAFSAAVVANLAKGREIDCGCFGPAAQKQITWWTVLRNIGLASAALLIATLPSSPLTPGSTASALSVSEAFAIVVATVSMLLAQRLGAESLAARRAVKQLRTVLPAVGLGT